MSPHSPQNRLSNTGHSGHQRPGDGSSAGAVVVNATFTANTTDSIQYVAQHTGQGATAEHHSQRGQGEMLAPLPGVKMCVAEEADASDATSRGQPASDATDAQIAAWFRGSAADNPANANSNSSAAGWMRGSVMKDSGKGAGKEADSGKGAGSGKNSTLKRQPKMARRRVQLDHNTLSAALVLKLCNEPGACA